MTISSGPTMEKCLFTLLVSLISLSGEAHAGLILNGSFEQGNYTGGAWTDIAPGSTDLTGWTNTGSGIINWHNSTEMMNPFDGARVADLNNGGNGLADTGILSQSFATDIAKSYLLTFYLAGPGTSFPDPRQVQVNIAGVQHIFSQAASPNTALVWGAETLTFEAISSTTTLAFTSVNGSGYWGPLLDMVSVDAVVPEPSTLIGLAWGAAVMLVSGRRHTKEGRRTVGVE
jgi:choice-of-anchor C domain-containing protein